MIKVLSFKSYVWMFPKMFNIQLPYITWSSLTRSEHQHSTFQKYNQYINTCEQHELPMEREWNRGSGICRQFLPIRHPSCCSRLIPMVVISDDTGTGPPREFLGPRAKENLPRPPPPILQIMKLKLSPPRCVISKESVQQKWIDELWFIKQLSACLFVWIYVFFNKSLHNLIYFNIRNRKFVT